MSDLRSCGKHPVIILHYHYYLISSHYHHQYCTTRPVHPRKVNVSSEYWILSRYNRYCWYHSIPYNFLSFINSNCLQSYQNILLLACKYTGCPKKTIQRFEIKIKSSECFFGAPSLYNFLILCLIITVRMLHVYMNPLSSPSAFSQFLKVSNYKYLLELTQSHRELKKP